VDKDYGWRGRECSYGFIGFIGFLSDAVNKPFKEPIEILDILKYVCNHIYTYDIKLEEMVMKRTTIFANEELLNALKHIADEEGISIAETIRQALDRFVAQRQKQLSLIGIGRSGRQDVSERFEELLWSKSATEVGAKI
jgi:predicted transcriptional regulator